MRLIARAGAALTCVVLSSSQATATPISYQFEVTAIQGPLAGTIETGTFTFDSSIIPAGGGVLLQTGLLSDFHFNWNGISYNETTANTGWLFWSPSGELRSFVFGNLFSAGSCAVFSDQESWCVDVNLDSPFMPIRSFGYSVGDGSVWLSNNIVTFAAVPPTAVPEPTSMTLLLLGAVGVTALRRGHVTGTCRTSS